MTVTVDLPEDAFARLRAEAKRRGVSIDLVIAELTSVLPPDPLPGKPTLSFIGLGSSASGRFALASIPSARLAACATGCGKRGGNLR